MDSRELAEWIAVHTHYMPLQDSWHQTGIIASAVLAPWSPRGKTPAPADFVPIEKPPQHEQQIAAALMELQKALGRN